VADVDWTFYIKPEGDQLLCSPADETPAPPSDAKADQLEIARAMDAIREATTLRPKSVRTAWAGLRTFAPDRNFVVGPDPDQPTFIWFVGQGGYGLQAAPAAARVGAELVRTGTVPTDVTARGLDIRRLSPSRPELSQPIT
jgi:D-arginine dehydrogenase